MLSSIDYHRPRTLRAALRLKETVPGARYVAGGTDLLVRIKSRLERPRALISLRSIPDLVGIEVGPSGVRIGAMTPLSDILAHPGLRERAPALVEAARWMGGAQIRNVATIGGNLVNASPACDTGPPLLALEAMVRILSADGARELPLDELFRGPRRTSLSPNEVLTEVRFDLPADDARSIFLRKSRVHMDLALVNLAVLLVADGARCLEVRIAAGAVAPSPLRLREAEALLTGREITPELLREAAAAAKQSVAPISDVRAGAEYRRHLVGVFVRRGVVALLPRRGAPS